MATKRWSANLSTHLARKNHEVNLGGGHDDHISSGHHNYLGDTYQDRGAVRFALSWSGVGQIVSAVLSVKTTAGVHMDIGSDPDIYVERITQSWSTNNDRSAFDSPAGDGWTDSPADYGNVHSTTTGRATADITTSANTWDTIDITDIVEAWAPSSVKKRSGSPGSALPNYGVLIRPVVEDSDAENTQFYAVGYNANSVKPTVLLTYTSAGSAPATTISAPTGTVADNTPTIIGSYSDADGDAMGKLDIQVAKVTSFTTLLWNLTQSTVFGGTASQWTKDYAGLPLLAGETYYVRARVYDSAGNVSAWSNTLTFTLQSVNGGVLPLPPPLRTRPIRIEIFGTTTGFGPGVLRAIIDDAKYGGVSDYANEVGEMYFTIPYNHPAAGEILPLQRHYRVSRFDPILGEYRTIGRGWVDDYDADEDEIIVHGSNYMAGLETSITAASTTYTSSFLGAIVQAELSAARNEPDSRIGFTLSSSGSGEIENTSTTAILMTAFQPRLQFIQQVAQVAMAQSSVRTIFYIDRDSPYHWHFIENRGSEELSIPRLEYGGNINGFRYLPGYATYANRIQAIGVRREGAAILYSTQSAGDTGTYGRITLPQLFQDVTDQTSLDKLTQRAARVAATPEKHLALVLRANRLVPFDGWDMGDNFRAQIHRGSAVNVNQLYTLWGLEVTWSPEGGTNLYLAVASKLT